MPLTKTSQLLELAEAGDDSLLRARVEASVASVGFTTWVDNALVTSLARLGEAAALDEIRGVKVGAIYRRLAKLARAVAPRKSTQINGRSAVVLVTPANGHTLAADLLSHLLLAEGYRADSLHPTDFDGDIFCGAVPDVVAVSIGLESEWRGLPDTLLKLRRRAPRALIMVGGSAVSNHRGAILPAGAVLCGGFAEALTTLRRSFAPNRAANHVRQAATSV